MQNHSLARTIARLTFYAVATVLLLWTASLTYSFVASALPGLGWYVPLLSLVVFDIGMLAWMFVFLNYSEGSMQRAIALLACAFDLVGLGLMVVAEILLGGQSWAVAPENLGEYAIWGIGIWTIGNVVAVVLFHLGSPEARRQMAIQAQKDAVLEAALQNLDSRRIADGGRLADSLSETMYRQLVSELLATEEQNAASSPGRQNGHYNSARPKPAGADTHQDAAPAISLEVPEDIRPRPWSGRPAER